MRVLRTRVLEVLSGLAGTGLALGFSALAGLRGDRPLHTRGGLWSGTLIVGRSAEALGVPLMDRPGRVRVQLRVSDAASWPLPWDITGLAVRVPRGSRRADLLFAGTGGSRWGRLVLRPGLRRDRGPLTTLIPLRTDKGRRMWLRADPVDAGRWRLSRSGVGGAWQPWATLVAHRSLADTVRFDPVGRPPAGTTGPRWAVLLRGPAYRRAQANPRTSRGT